MISELIKYFICTNSIIHCRTILARRHALTSMVLLPFAVNADEYSRRARGFWERKGVDLPLLVRKDLKSWRVQIIGLEVGPFFKIKKGTPATFLWFTVNNTISLVLFLRSQAVK